LLISKQNLIRAAHARIFRYYSDRLLDSWKEERSGFRCAGFGFRFSKFGIRIDRRAS
jgi:hypothetical protein